MTSTDLELLFPQWQGGGQDLSTYEGALELKRLYYDSHHARLAEVDVTTQPISPLQNNIIGYADVLTQMKRAQSIIEQAKPQHLLTIGGGCDADIPSIAYLNQQLEGDMAVIWFDAHGDLNTPQSSTSHYFYGMPLRALLGEGDAGVLALIPRPLTPEQVVMVGVRDLDQPEADFIQQQSITVLDVATVEQSIDTLIRAIQQTGKTHLYLHIDLDVLDRDEFPHIPLAVAGGIKIKTFSRILSALKEAFHVAGVGVFEYQPAGVKIPIITEIIKFIKPLETN